MRLEIGQQVCFSSLLHSLGSPHYFPKWRCHTQPVSLQELASRSLLAKRRDGGDSVPIELADDCSLPQVYSPAPFPPSHDRMETIVVAWQVGAEELRATLDHITTDMLALSEVLQTTAVTKHTLYLHP